MNKLLTDISVELHVPSFEIAKKFYKGLGFEVVWERNNSSPDKRFMVMKRGEYGIINFFSGSEEVYTQSYFKNFPKNTKRGYAVEITIPIDGLEDFYKTCLEKYKESIVKHPDIRAFRAKGRKDFRMVDPFGFYLCFVERYNWVEGRDKFGNTIK
jgi:catechol 2,3-dioxygenase-like lactoylglutathione lyase family enzyme